MIQRTPLLAAAVLAGALASPPAYAQSEPFVGQLMMFAGTFCPRGWASTDGQLLSIATNSALFSLLGTNFGGDGRTTFGLPDLRGRSAVGEGTGPGLDAVRVGQSGGATSATIAIGNMPLHTHSAMISGTAEKGDTDNPSGAVPARLQNRKIYKGGSAVDAPMAAQITIGSTGGGAPISVRDPYLGMTMCIALVGVYPSRS